MRIGECTCQVSSLELPTHRSHSALPHERNIHHDQHASTRHCPHAETSCTSKRSLSAHQSAGQGTPIGWLIGGVVGAFLLFGLFAYCWRVSPDGFSSVAQ